MREDFGVLLWVIGPGGTAQGRWFPWVRLEVSHRNRLGAETPCVNAQAVRERNKRPSMALIGMAGYPVTSSGANNLISSSFSSTTAAININVFTLKLNWWHKHTRTHTQKSLETGSSLLCKAANYFNTQKGSPISLSVIMLAAPRGRRVTLNPREKFRWWETLRRRLSHGHCPARRPVDVPLFL